MLNGEKRLDFVGVGLNSLDTVLRVPHFPAFNSKLQVRSSALLPGGQVATAAVACHRWGLKCRYVGKIGDDRAGQMQRESLEREGLDFELLEAKDCASQQAFILVDESSGERTILWQRDPKLDIDPNELRREWITDARLLHVDGHPSAPAITAARWAREAGMIVTSDLDNIYADVETLLRYVNVAIGSRDFPERLTGISDLLCSLPEIKSRFGCDVVGTTLGDGGALIWDGNEFLSSPAFEVEAVDTTGAGDVFHAGLAYGLLAGWNWERILHFSCAAASLSCSAQGARGGIKPLDEIEKLGECGRTLPPLYEGEAWSGHPASSAQRMSATPTRMAKTR